jgi:molybdate/tungstate transport system substrate-binding protein
MGGLQKTHPFQSSLPGLAVSMHAWPWSEPSSFMKNTSSILPAVLLCLVILVSACTGTASNSSGKTPLVVFAAGSLIIPFDDLETAFESKYPEIDVQAQYHGSIQVMRHVTELHEPIDVVATADASLIPMLMVATKNLDTGLPYANWYIIFASNHLAIAFRPESLYANEINADNWYSVLSRPDVKVGIADPRFDASGYRTLMAFGLAQDYYHDPKIFMKMFGGDFTHPLGIFTEEDLTTIIVPEILETRTGSHIVIRGASMALIALLESGDLDYAFEYETVINQHKLNMIHLPGALNLGEAGLAEPYGTVLVNLDFQRFASVKPVFRGERIGYGITIPSNAPHPDQALLFLEFLLGPEGRAVMQKNSHPMVDPALGFGYQDIPPDLQPYCTPEGAP